MREASRIRDYFERASWRPSAGREYLIQERQRLILSELRAAHTMLPAMSLCDVGCGTGADLIAWRDAGLQAGSLAGTELVPARAQAARTSLPEAKIRLVEGFELPFASARFDACTASLVLSTIRRPDDRAELMNEMARVTKPGGLLLVYDFAIRKPWNRNVVALTTRELADIWGRPAAVRPAGPLLPALNVVLRLPTVIAKGAVATLPRTHRLWVWRTALGTGVQSDHK